MRPLDRMKVFSLLQDRKSEIKGEVFQTYVSIPGFKNSIFGQFSLSRYFNIMSCYDIRETWGGFRCCPQFLVVSSCYRICGYRSQKWRPHACPNGPKSTQGLKKDAHAGLIYQKEQQNVPAAIIRVSNADIQCKCIVRGMQEDRNIELAVLVITFARCAFYLYDVNNLFPTFIYTNSYI